MDKKIIVILLLAIIGVLAYLYLKPKKQATDTAKDTTKDTATDTADTTDTTDTTKGTPTGRRINNLERPINRFSNSFKH